jgi:predicted O-methyltransferase YrrM
MSNFIVGLKRSLLIKSQIPIGISNKLSNILVKKIVRHEYDEKYDLGFFNSYFNNEYTIGPLQKDEAILLYGMIKVLRPKVCVEFGFCLGHSAFSTLNAIDEDASLFSYDISDSAEEIATKHFYGKFSNFRFFKKSQEDFEASDIGNKKIDFVFFDASHDLQMNINTFNKIKPFLSDNAFIAIHDTGLWNKKYLKPKHHVVLNYAPHKEIEGSISHQNEEREFSNWVLDNVKGFSALHFHTLNTLRHGLTILSNVDPRLPV